MADDRQETTEKQETAEGRVEIAPGLLVLADGPGRWALWDDATEVCFIYDTKDRAVLAAERLAAERAEHAND